MCCSASDGEKQCAVVDASRFLACSVCRVCFSLPLCSVLKVCTCAPHKGDKYRWGLATPSQLPIVWALLECTLQFAVLRRQFPQAVLTHAPHIHSKP